MLGKGDAVMAEVISFKKRDKALPKTTPVTAAQMLAEDYVYAFANKELLSRVAQHADLMTKFIFDCLGFKKSDESLLLRQKALRQWTLEALGQRILDSGESDWRSQPSFYGATYLEWFERCLLVSEVREAVLRDETRPPDS